MTKGEACEIISQCVQSGKIPIDDAAHREAKVKLLEIERGEKREILLHIRDSISQIMQQIQSKDIAIKELKRLKSKLRVLFSEIDLYIEARTIEVDERED